MTWWVFRDMGFVCERYYWLITKVMLLSPFRGGRGRKILFQVPWSVESRGLFTYGDILHCNARHYNTFSLTAAQIGSLSGTFLLKANNKLFWWLATNNALPDIRHSISALLLHPLLYAIWQTFLERDRFHAHASNAPSITILLLFHYLKLELPIYRIFHHAKIDHQKNHIFSILIENNWLGQFCLRFLLFIITN